MFEVGGYTGEVIRHESQDRYAWFTHKAWIEKYPKHKDLLGESPSLSTALLLGTADGSFTLPLNKVVKFLHNGSEDSLHFFAVATLKRGEKASSPTGQKK